MAFQINGEKIHIHCNIRGPLAIHLKNNCFNYYAYHGEHDVMYRTIESLCCVSETI